MASSASAPTIPPPSSSSEPQSKPRTKTLPTDQFNNKNPMIHTVALGVTPLALIGLCLPPRRLDLRAVMLGGVALWGTNQLAHDYSGRSFVQRFSSRMASLTGTELPEKAKATQARIREEKERRERLRALREEMLRAGPVPAKGEGWNEDQKRVLLEAYERQRREKEGVEVVRKEESEKGIIEKIWMGNAEPDWKEKREQKEKEALQEGGGGYLGLITDQISEVWRGSKKSQGDSAKEKTSDNAKDS